MIAIPDARLSQVCRGISAHAHERLTAGDLSGFNVEATTRRDETFLRLLLQYEKSGRILLDESDRHDIREAYGMSEHNLKIVEGEVLAARLGCDKTQIEQLHIWQLVLKPVVDHISTMYYALQDSLRRPALSLRRR